MDTVIGPVIMFLFIVGWLVDLSLHSLPSHRLCIDRIPAWTWSFGLAFGIVTQELVANRLSLLFCPPHGDEFLLIGRWMSRHGWLPIWPHNNTYLESWKGPMILWVIIRDCIECLSLSPAISSTFGGCSFAPLLLLVLQKSVGQLWRVLGDHWWALMANSRAINNICVRVKPEINV